MDKIVTTLDKTTETLRKELERLNAKGLNEIFKFFYRLNHQHGSMITDDRFTEFLESFKSNPFRVNEDKEFKKQLIDNLIEFSEDHMSLITAAILVKSDFTIDEIISNYYSNVNAFGYDVF